jgi:signal transduction histidine kinase/ligand-binding sensor domain-containing protein/CheY-like chemotaxis protein
MSAKARAAARALLVVACVLQTPASALDARKGLNQFVRTVWSVDAGVSSGPVSAIVQSRDGYIWVGTERGLARFDGVRFEVFNTANTPAFSNNRVTALAEDRDGTLWVGTFGGGVVRYRDGRFTPLTRKDGLLTDLVRSLYEDSSGAVWVGTRGDGELPGGLNVVRDGRVVSKYTAADGLTNDDVWSLCEDRDGTLWIGTFGGGVVRLRDGRFTALTTRDGLANDDVRAIRQDASGVVWIGTHGGGVTRYEAGRLESVTTADGLSSDLVITLSLGRDGDLWVGTANGGVDRIRDGRVSAFRAADGLPSDSVGAVYEDREGGLWVGTGSGDLCSLREGSFTAYTTKEGLSFDTVCPILEGRDGSVWVGTFGGGLNRFRDGRFTAYTTKDGLAGDNVNSLYEDAAGALWIGAYGGGLSRFDGVRFETFTTRDGLSSDKIKAIAGDGAGGLWVGTDGGGLCRLRDRKFVAYTTADGLSNNVVGALLVGRGGRLWIGTDGGGLCRYEDGRFSALTTADGLSNNRVWSLYEDASGDLWVGTDGGLNLYRGGRFTPFTLKQGLFDESINQILEDDAGHLWLSTPRGIYRVAKAELVDVAEGRASAVAPTAYGQSDGMKSEECTRWFQPAGCKTRDGKLWFPTVKGAVTIDPNALSAPRAPAPVLVEQVLADGDPVPAGDGVVVPPGNQKLEFHYTCLSFASPAKIRFRYKLEGFDRDWVDAGPRRAAYYTNLPPGDYAFTVMARTSDGRWVEAAAPFRFHAAAPWWKTWPALALYVTTLALLLWAGVSLRVRALRVRNEALERAVGERTRELADKVDELARSERRAGESERLAIKQAERAVEANRAKSVFLSNMSHELRTPLNAVIGFAQLMRRHTPRSAEDREYLATILRSGEHLLSLINDVLSISKIEAGKVTLEDAPFDLGRLVESCAEMVRPRARAKGLELALDVARGLPATVRGDEGKVRQVLINLLGNAVKFTDEGGVALRCSWRDGVASFEVEDTGFGIAEEEMSRLFETFSQTESGRRSQEGTGLGLAISRSFVMLMGGEISVESALGRGTIFRVGVPLPVSAEPVAGLEAQTVVALEPGQPVRRILVVDDTPENREILVRLLGPLGFEMREAGDGRAAVEMWKSWRPHLVWMDMRMPVLDGYGATRRIREAEAASPDGQPRTVIISLTASAFEHDRDAILAAGCDDFVTKPYREATIFEKLAAHLGVRYVYEEGAPEDEGGPAPVDRAEVARLPAELRRRLRYGVDSGDVSLTSGAVADVRRHDARLARELDRLVRAYRFEELLELLDAEDFAPDGG